MTVTLPLAELEGFALELARTAGAIANAYFRSPLAIENKQAGGYDPVTEADRAIEHILRKEILGRYPDHSIVGEEEGTHVAGSAYTWYIDPIDGTRSFMMGSPLWGTLVGLTHQEVPQFGLLVQPVLGEVFLGTQNGSWLIRAEQRQRLTARGSKDLSGAAIASTHPDLFSGEEARAFQRLVACCELSRYGGDCYNYAMLAAGFIDLVVEAKLKPWDIVPLVPILEGAGCVVTNWQGGSVLAGGLVVAAATPDLHRAALNVLQGESRI
jgi:histidinol phosphatase-like enzyme (inositol monophosphatase family)